jgi:hypothetical protein
MAGTAFPILLYKEERMLTRLFVEKRRTSPNFLRRVEVEMH